MKSNSNKPPSLLTMAAELIATLMVLLFGMALVIILSTKILSADKSMSLLVLPLISGTAGGVLLGLLFFHPKEWAETEAELRIVEVSTLGALLLVMLSTLIDIKPNFVLQSLSFILGLAFGAIMIVSIRSLAQIHDWSEAEKEKNDSKDSIEANLSEGKRNEPTN